QRRASSILRLSASAPAARIFPDASAETKKATFARVWKALFRQSMKCGQLAPAEWRSTELFPSEQMLVRRLRCGVGITSLTLGSFTGRSKRATNGDMPAPVITVAQMRDWEQATWAVGRTEEEVIRRVGRLVADRAAQMTNPADLVLVLAGKG